MKSGSGAVFSGTKLTLVQVRADCPGPISGGTATVRRVVGQIPPSTARRHAGAPLANQPMCTTVTLRGHQTTAEVIHNAYPQPPEFHVKHDVEGVWSLWIQTWTTRERGTGFT